MLLNPETAQRRQPPSRPAIPSGKSPPESIESSQTLSARLAASKLTQSAGPRYRPVHEQRCPEMLHE